MKVDKYQYHDRCLSCKSEQFSDQGPSKCPILDTNFHLVKCNNCGLVFVNPTPDEDEISKIYSTEYRLGYKSWIKRVLDIYNKAVFASEAKFINSFINKGKVIDIGYGSGEMLSALGPSWEKYGYDPYSKKEDRVSIEKRLGIKTFSSTESLTSQSFDLVILRNVIEHTTKFRNLFKVARKLLKPGGLLFIRTPNVDSLDFRLFGTDWYETYMGGHIVFFNTKNIRTLARETGFKTVFIRPTPSSPILSFVRSVQLKYSISNRFLLAALIPASVLYSLFSSFFNNGGDVLAVLKKNRA